MLIGKVVGTLVSTRKEPSLDGLKFLLLKQLDIEGEETGGYRVAADAVGAGMGEVVLFATGSSARQTKMTDRRPCDAVRTSPLATTGRPVLSTTRAVML